MPKVIIIGAGIGGLTAAIAFQQQGFSVKVYEKTSQLSNIGGAFIIYCHGTRILQKLGLQYIIDSFYTDVQNFICIDQSEILMNSSFEKFYSNCGGFLLPMSRTDLQFKLLESIPSDNLYMGHKCVKITQDEEKVKVYFENGVEDEADILIGADGIYSTVRDSVTSSHVQYTGICFWGGILKDKYCIDIPKKTLVNILGENKISWIVPLSHNRQMWYIAHRMPEENLVRGSDKIAQLPTFCSNWNKYIDQILVAPQDEYNFALPVYEISSIDRWTKGRIALIGDAAHAFGPVIGQGCSLAMEDAYILASCISNSSQNISQGLEQYEFIRKSIVSELHGFENKQQTMRITNNPLFIQQRNQIISSSPVEKLLEPIANLINPTIFQQQVDASKILTL